MSTYLLLHNDTAFWSHWRDGQCIATFQEPIPSLPVTTAREKPPHDLLPWAVPDASESKHIEWCTPDSSTTCPWLTVAHQRVHLIVDSPIEAVEVRWLEHSSNRIQQYRLRQQMLKGMSRQYPEARVRCHGKFGHRDLLTAHTARLPDTWCAWLERLQHRRMTVISMQTASEVWASIEPSENESSVEPQGERPRAWHQENQLHVIRQPVGLRQLLVHAGHPVFTRQVRSGVESVESLVASVKETLDHLQAEELVEGCLSIRTSGISIDGTAALAALPDVSSVNRADEGASASVLDDHIDQLHQQSAQMHGDKFMNNVGVGSIRRKLRRVHVARHHLTGHACHPVLEKYLERRAYAGLRIATLAAGAIACQFVAMAVVIGVDNVQRHRAIEAQNRIAESEQQKLMEEATGLHPEPIRMVNALMARSELVQSFAIKPSYWMPELAAVMELHPDVQLSELDWAVATEEKKHHSQPAQPLANTRVRLSLRGTIKEAAGESLPDSIHDSTALLSSQQASLTDFVSALQQLPLVDDIQIQQSPVNVYLSGLENSAVNPVRSPVTADQQFGDPGGGRFDISVGLFNLSVGSVILSDSDVALLRPDARLP